MLNINSRSQTFQVSRKHVLHKLEQKDNFHQMRVSEDFIKIYPFKTCQRVQPAFTFISYKFMACL